MATPDIRIDTSLLERRLAVLRRDEIPTAMRNAVNDLARDVMDREDQEMRRVFDRPTPFIMRGQLFKQKATKQTPVAVIWFKDKFGKGWGDAIERAITPHIPGYPNTREHKGMERALINAGLMRTGQYLIPSRTARLDRYGNITGSQASKMLNDLGAFRGISGYTSETSASKVRYMWGTVKTKTGKKVTGIWIRSRLMSGAGNALVMHVVDSKPRYQKRFRYHEVAERWAKIRAPRHARLAIEHAIRRRQ